MKVLFEDLTIETKGENDMINITDNLIQLLNQVDIHKGLLTIFVPGSTAALTTIEYEPGLKIDFPSALKRIVPSNIPYEHDNTWHDGNGHSHVKVSLIGPSLIIPFRDGILTLGTWQQVVLIEMDTNPRSRRLVIQIMGE
ncbi:secondary thiamine-phosphate synthase enzyme YjbQ [Thermoproteota archaeon]